MNSNLRVQSRKQALRVSILQRRDSMSFDNRSALSGRVITNLFRVPEFSGAETVFFFVNFRSEVETLDGIRRAISQGKKVAVPYCVLDERILKFVEIRDFEKDLMVDAYNILEPLPSLRRKKTLSPDAADVVLFPGSVFDTRGGRMGYGAGYYDKTFADVKKTPFMALAFDFQVLPVGSFVPMANHDLPVHKILTEKKIIECRKI